MTRPLIKLKIILWNGMEENQYDIIFVQRKREIAWESECERKCGGECVCPLERDRERERERTDGIASRRR